MQLSAKPRHACAQLVAGCGMLHAAHRVCTKLHGPTRPCVHARPPTLVGVPPPHVLKAVARVAGHAPPRHGQHVEGPPLRVHGRGGAAGALWLPCRACVRMHLQRRQVHASMHAQAGRRADACLRACMPPCALLHACICGGSRAGSEHAARTTKPQRTRWMRSPPPGMLPRPALSDDCPASEVCFYLEMDPLPCLCH